MTMEPPIWELNSHDFRVGFDFLILLLPLLDTNFSLGIRSGSADILSLSGVRMTWDFSHKAEHVGTENPAALLKLPQVINST